MPGKRAASGRVPNPWFRFYSEFSDDPKVQMMPEVMQRRLVMIFCLRCKEQLETLRETQIAFHLRISVEDLHETKAVFIENGFINEHWEVINWSRRQFISDSSTERVRTYRERKKQSETLHRKNEAFHETGETETVTAPEQNRTEQSRSEQSTTELPDGLVRQIVCAHPKSKARSLTPDLVRHVDEIAVFEAIEAECKKAGCTPREAGEMLLEITHGFAEKIPRSEWRYLKDVAEFYRTFEYRRSLDEFFKSNGATHGNNQPNRTQERVSANRDAIRRAAERRGWVSPHGAGDADGGSVSTPGPEPVAGRVSERLRDSGGAPRNHTSHNGTSGTPHKARAEVLSAAERSSARNGDPHG